MNTETNISDLDIDTPEWIAQDLTVACVEAIVQGGCASGAYMPAVTYYQAAQTMAEHGDNVLDYIDNAMGELPSVPQGTSWSGMACHFLSCAVELWASNALAQVEDIDED